MENSEAGQPNGGLKELGQDFRNPCAFGPLHCYPAERCLPAQIFFLILILILAFLDLVAAVPRCVSALRFF